MSFIWNRRRGIAIFALTGVGLYYSTKFAISQFLDSRSKSSALKINQDLSKASFETFQPEYDSTIISFLDNIKKFMKERLPVELLIKRLKELPKNDAAIKKEKQDLWNEIKVNCFARVIFSVYSLVLVVVLLRTQLNIIGRMTYRENLRSKERQDESENELQSESQNDSLGDLGAAYLEYFSYFLNNGLEKIAQISQQTSVKVTENLSLSQKFPIEEIEICVQMLRKQAAEVFLKRDNTLQSILFPMTDSDCDEIRARSHHFKFDQKLLQFIIDDTRDILECDQFYQVVQASLNRAWGEINERCQNTIVQQLALPNVLPTINQIVDTMYLPQDNEWLPSITSLHDLQAFCAMVYCSE